MWNPWRGCNEVSPGCKNCYMMAQCAEYDKDGHDFAINKTQWNMPLKKTKGNAWKIPNDSIVEVCLTSDFFLEEADALRPQVWEMIRQRPRVMFLIITKRTNRIHSSLPEDWGDGYDNVIISATVENQEYADKRLKEMLAVPMKHRGITVAPILDAVDLTDYLATGKFEQVSVGGERAGWNSRPCKAEWVKNIARQCYVTGVKFQFYQTGEVWIMGTERERVSSSAHQKYKANHFEKLWLQEFRSLGLKEDI